MCFRVYYKMGIKVFYLDIPFGTAAQQAIHYRDACSVLRRVYKNVEIMHAEMKPARDVPVVSATQDGSYA